MAYTLSTVRDNVRNRLDDEDYEQEFLDRAINYAQWKLTNKYKLSFLETSEDLAINSGDVEVALPTDHHETLHLRVTSPVNMRSNISDNFWNYTDFIQSYISPSDNPPAMPYNWSEYARAIKFSAPADQSYTLKIDYQKRAPTLVNDTDIPVIPEEFQELLEVAAYMRIAKREDDYDVKSQEMIDYSDMLLDYLHVYGRKKQPGGLRTMRVSKRR